MYIIEPVLSYDFVHGSTNKNYLQPIFIIQKRIFRKIFKASNLFHTIPLFDKANNFTVHELLLMQLLQKSTNNISVFSKAIKISTRSSKLDLIEQKLHRKQIMKLSLEHQSIKLLNCLKKQRILLDADLGSQCPNMRKKGVCEYNSYS